MAKDARRIREFRDREPYINGVLSLFESSGFSVEFVYDQEPGFRSWGARIQPIGELAQEMGPTYQLLLWVDRFSEFQPRSIERIREALLDARPRLREDIAFLISDDDNVANAVLSLPSETTVVAFSLNKLREFQTPAGPDFKRHLLSRVFSRDPYRLSGAVTNRWQFFGRDRLVAELVASATAGHKIGLFGLRKIGKTSVLLRLIEQIQRSNQGIVVGYLQVARIDAVRRSADYFLWSLGQSIFMALPKGGAHDGRFKLLGRYEVFSDVPAGVSIPELFVRDLGVLLREPTARICFMLDEIERMWPSSGETNTSEWRVEFPRVWQIVRSLDQEFPGRCSVIVAGTNPECIEQAKIGAIDNPLFQYIQVRYLPFLEKADAGLLLKELGSRAGLHWNDDACRAAYELVSGHPALLRIVGSVVYSQGRDHERRRIISEPIVRDATAPAARSSNPILSEMCGAIREGYPDDFMLLEFLAENKIGEYQQYSAMFPDAVQHLLGYGLISMDQSGVPSTIAFSLLQTFLQGTLRGRARPGPSSTTGPLPETIGEYKVQASIGRAGGGGRVYKAIDLAGGAVALKVLHSSSLAALTREVEILKELEHKNVVKVFEYGHDAHYGNYIVMEYLEGYSWREHCNRAGRLRPREAREKLGQVLEALAYLHPKRMPTSAGGDLDIQALLASRIGYIHRDVKPENIVEVARRGAVLIDFGISSKAGDPTKTTSSTPGYLPPDFVFGTWDADVDLYQAGLTFLQVLIGEVYTGLEAERRDYRVILEKDPELPRAVKRVVLRLCDEQRCDRFKSAGEALDSLRSK